MGELTVRLIVFCNFVSVRKYIHLALIRDFHASQLFRIQKYKLIYASLNLCFLRSFSVLSINLAFVPS